MITLELGEGEAKSLLEYWDRIRRKRWCDCKQALHYSKVVPAEREKWLKYRAGKKPLYLQAARRCRDLRNKLRKPLKPGEYPKSQIRLAENATCISARVHQDREEYNQLYQCCTGGFPDINILISQCAIELERQHPGEWTDLYYETCERIGQFILDSEMNVSAMNLVALALEDIDETWNGEESTKL